MRKPDGSLLMKLIKLYLNLVAPCVLFFMAQLYSQNSVSTDSLNVLKKQTFNEFIGNFNIPFPAITWNAFDDACRIINETYNIDDCGDVVRNKSGYAEKK